MILMRLQHHLALQGRNGEAQQCHPEPALQEEVAILREDLVQPACPEEEKGRR